VGSAAGGVRRASARSTYSRCPSGWWALAANASVHRPIRYVEYHEPAVIRVAWMLAASLLLYLWFRALQWMQSREVTGSGQRLVLLLVLLPASLLASVNVGLLLPFLLLLVLALMGLPTLPDSPGGYVLGAGVLVESLLWTLVLSRSYRFVTWEVSSSLATDSATSHHETLAAVPAPQADGPERLER